MILNHYHSNKRSTMKINFDGCNDNGKNITNTNNINNKNNSKRLINDSILLFHH